MRYIASVSFGKDSLAMLLLILEKNLPLNEVIFYDTGMEFECIYKIRDKIKPILKQKNIKFTELKPKKPFKYTMLKHEHKTRNGETKYGYGWCGGCCRWGTSEKLQAIDKYCKNAIQYVGIAKDEPKRLQRLTKNKIAILDIYNMTEKQSLSYCYSKGYNWKEGNIDLYTILDRVSCWCCRNKNLKELANYYKYLPKYFNNLIELEQKIGEPMKKPYKLNDRFKGEQMTLWD